MTDLHKAIEAARMLRANITALVRDDQEGEPSSDNLVVIQDSFDGETTLEHELEEAVKAEDDDKILVDGITTRINELVGRRDRLKRRIEARRGLIEQAMTVASWPKYETPCGTISLSKAPAKVAIDDEHAIPSQFFDRQDPVLNKTSIGKVLKERHKMLEAAKSIRDSVLHEAELRRIELEYPTIPGVHLEFGGVNLTIRRK